jgi:hypothetical protein
MLFLNPRQRGDVLYLAVFRGQDMQDGPDAIMPRDYSHQAFVMRYQNVSAVCHGIFFREDPVIQLVCANRFPNIQKLILFTFPITSLGAKLWATCRHIQLPRREELTS